MPKIIEVNSEVTLILMQDSSVIEVVTSSLNFYPQVGDIVEVNEYAGRLIVNKVRMNASVPIGNEVYSGPNVVNKIAYALFAIFLGWLGVHKFYAGRVGMGILYLLFCWTVIPGLVGFIEGIVALTRRADVYGNIYV